MFSVDLWVHWLHLLAAIAWLGGALEVSLAVNPVLTRDLPDDMRQKVQRDLRRRFVVLQWITWPVLAVTGVAKLGGLAAFRPELFFGSFGRILCLKLVLVAGAVFLALRKPLQTTFWARVNMAVLAGIVLCGALMRYSLW